MQIHLSNRKVWSFLNFQGSRVSTLNLGSIRPSELDVPMPYCIHISHHLFKWSKTSRCHLLILQEFSQNA